MTRSIALILLAMLSGCATATGGSPAPPDAMPVGTTDAGFGARPMMPIDWSLDVTVLAGPDANEVAPAHLRPSRYTVFPDGSLHYADADEDEFDRGTAWLPPRTRTLPVPELDGVWALAWSLGFVDPAAGDAPRNLDLIRPPASGHAFVIVVGANEVRRMFVYDSDGSDGHENAARLVRHLASLAWATDLVEEPSTIEPKRYDLGADPYARYRNR